MLGNGENQNEFIQSKSKKFNEAFILMKYDEAKETQKDRDFISDVYNP